MRGRPTKVPYTWPAINTLERLHAELGAQILENKADALKLSGKMLHVEAVIKMLAPDYNLAGITVSAGIPANGSSAALSIGRHWMCCGRQPSR